MAKRKHKGRGKTQRESENTKGEEDFKIIVKIIIQRIKNMSLMKYTIISIKLLCN